MDGKDNGKSLTWGFEERHYRGNDGRQVVEHITVGSPPKDYPRFYGLMPVSVQVPGKGTAMVQVPFPILEVECPWQALEKFEEAALASRDYAMDCAKQQVNNQLQAEQKQQASQIIRPGM